MGYFPLCMDLTGKRVLLVGNGPQTADKAEKLLAFGPELGRCETVTAEMLDHRTAFVVVGDMPLEAAREISGLCAAMHVPINVVDQPSLSTFFFPALLTRGDVTISVSTGGKSPGAASILSRRIEDKLPPDTADIVDQLHALRQQLYASYSKETARALLREAAQRAFDE